MASSLPPLVQASAGAVGSLISNAAVYPLDVLVTRLQTASSGRKAGKQVATTSRLATLPATVRRMLAEGGIGSFYRGLVSDSASTFISNFLYFYFYTFLRDFLLRRKSGKPTNIKNAPPQILSAIEEIVVGMVAGMISKGVTAPLSNLTVRAQTAVAAKKAQAKHEEEPKAVLEVEDSSDDDEGDYASPSSWSIAQDIYEEKGWTGFWSGYKSTILLASLRPFGELQLDSSLDWQTINPAISFYLFALFKRAIIPTKHQSHPRPLQTFTTSAVAASMASTVVYPLILAKTRLQFKSPSGRKLYNGNVDVFRKTIKKKGLAGMYAGLEAQVLKNFFSEGLKLLVKERLELLIVLLYRRALHREMEQ